MTLCWYSRLSYHVSIRQLDATSACSCFTNNTCCSFDSFALERNISFFSWNYDWKQLNNHYFFMTQMENHINRKELQCYSFFNRMWLYACPIAPSFLQPCWLIGAYMWCQHPPLLQLVALQQGEQWHYAAGHVFWSPSHTSFSSSPSLWPQKQACLSLFLNHSFLFSFPLSPLACGVAFHATSCSSAGFVQSWC